MLLSRRIRILFVGIGTLGLFITPLAARWNGARSDGTAIGGLLPFSDASGYYHCARVIAEGARLRATDQGAFCSRRPLFTSALAGLLVLSGQDLRWSLAILVCLTALTCLVAAWEVLRTQASGIACGLFVVTLFLFYRPYVGATLTEHLGLALGAAGFAALWQGIRRRLSWLVLIGLFVLALAENARAGALLVLPALALWFASVFAGQRRFSWRRLGEATVAITLAFALNGVLVRAIGVPGAAFSNYPYHLYGIVHGGDYRLVLKEHPELARLGEAERADAILALAKRRLYEDPLSVTRGCLRAWRHFLLRPYLFRFMLDRRLDILFRLLALGGLAYCVTRWREPTASILAVVAAATLVSVPLIPPWDVDVRLYAATMPFIAALPAVAVSFLLARWRRKWRTEDQANAGSAVPLLAAAACLTGLAILSPFVARVLRDPPVFSNGPGTDCDETFYVRMPQGSMVSVIPNDEVHRDYPLEVRQREFRQGLHEFRGDFPGLADELMRIKAPFLLANVLGLQPFRSAFLVVEPARVSQVPMGSGFWRVCATPATDPIARQYGLVYATSVEPATPLR